MPKLTLADVANILGNPTSAANTINANSTLIETALENTLSRDGSTPNQMNSDFDMNNNDILNVDNIDADNFILRGQMLIPSDVSTLPDDVMLKSENLSGLTDLGTSQSNIQVTSSFIDKAEAASATIPTRNKRVRTQFYDSTATKKVGGANYRESSASEVAKYPTRSWFQSNGGSRYWLLDELRPNAYQFGGIGDGIADDAVALQQLLDFWSPQAQLASGTVTTRPLAMAGGGVTHIPKGVWRHTATLNQNAFIVIEGDGMAMFPQAPMDGTTYGQYSFPNATILRPDFPLADRALGVGIQTSPYVLKPVTGQTVGTRFRSIDPDLTNASVDNGDINYCEGSNVSDLTVWPVDEIFAGIRWTAASNSKLSRFGVRNVKRGIICESTWESTVYEPKIYDFKDYGIYGGIGNLHSFGVFGGWIHAGGRVLAGDRPTGIRAGFFNGLVLDAIAIDECWDAIHLATGTGAVINGIHSERTKNVWLTTNNAFGIRGHGNHMIQNVVDARTYTDSIIWDGNNCDVEINVTSNLTGQGDGTNHPGKTYVVGLNPNTGTNTNLFFATGNHTTAIFRGMPKLASDAASVPRLSGEIKFIYEQNEFLVAGWNNTNSMHEDLQISGAAGVTYTRTVYVNGVAAGRVDITTDGWRWYDETGTLVLGWSTTNNRVLFATNLSLQQVFGTPESFRDEAKGSLVTDNSLSGLYIKGSASGSSTGWRSIGDIDEESTTTNLTAIGNAINTTNKRRGKVVFNTTNSHAYRSAGTATNSVWVSLRDGTTITPV